MFPFRPEINLIEQRNWIGGLFKYLINLEKFWKRPTIEFFMHLSTLLHLDFEITNSIRLILRESFEFYNCSELFNNK